MNRLDLESRPEGGRPHEEIAVLAAMLERATDLEYAADILDSRAPSPERAALARQARAFRAAIRAHIDRLGPTPAPAPRGETP